MRRIKTVKIFLIVAIVSLQSDFVIAEQVQMKKWNTPDSDAISKQIDQAHRIRSIVGLKDFVQVYQTALEKSQTEADYKALVETYGSTQSNMAMAKYPNNPLVSSFESVKGLLKSDINKMEFQVVEDESGYRGFVSIKENDSEGNIAVSKSQTLPFVLEKGRWKFGR